MRSRIRARLTHLALAAIYSGSACSPATDPSSASGGAAGTGGVGGNGQGGAAGTSGGSQGGSSGNGGAGGTATGGASGASGAGNGGAGAGNGGGAGAGAGGSSAGSAGSGGSAGAAGSGAGAGGSAGNGGDCTPSTGTEDVGTSSLRDKATCLVWQKTASGKNTNKQALKYCDELVQDGFDDWRVATTSELVSWPLLVESGDAYITAPTYIPTASTSDEEGCIGNCHSCNITKYNASGAPGCAWQGVDFKGPTVCVRDTAAAGTLPTGFEPSSCGECAGKTDSEFKQVDCLPFAAP